MLPVAGRALAFASATRQDSVVWGRERSTHICRRSSGTRAKYDSDTPHHSTIRTAGGHRHQMDLHRQNPACGHRRISTDPFKGSGNMQTRAATAGIAARKSRRRPLQQPLPLPPQAPCYQIASWRSAGTKTAVPGCLRPPNWCSMQLRFPSGSPTRQAAALLPPPIFLQAPAKIAESSSHSSELTFPIDPRNPKLVQQHFSRSKSSAIRFVQRKTGSPFWLGP